MQKREALTSSGFNCSAFSDEAFALNLRFKQLFHRDSDRCRFQPELLPHSPSWVRGVCLLSEGEEVEFQKKGGERAPPASPRGLCSRFCPFFLPFTASGPHAPSPLGGGRRSRCPQEGKPFSGPLSRSPGGGGDGGRLGCLGALKMGEGGQEGGATR